MRTISTLAAFLFMVYIAGIVSLSGCNSKPTEVSDNSLVDGITRATPNDGELRAAEEGPIRSALGQPEIDLDSFRLGISGLVDSPFSLTWTEVQRRPAIESGVILMYCVEGWEVWGNWKGILVEDMLEEASARSDGKHVMFHCIDGYTTALPISYIQKYDVMLAYEVNGKPLKEHDGFPLRVVAFGKYGYKWAKWVTEIEVVDSSMDGYWEARGYSDSANVPVDRRRYYEGDDAERLEY